MTMIDLKTTWTRLQGRWRTMRQVPTVFVFGASAGVQGEELALAAFESWCAAHPGAICRVALSGRWLLHCVPTAAPDAPAPRVQAVQQWTHYLDADEASLLKDWVVREAPVSGAKHLCAAPRPLLEALQLHATAHGVQLDWVGPWWAQGVQAWLASLQPQAEGEQALRTLHLVEPGLVTHVQALASPDRSLQLQRVWADRAMPTTAADTAMVVTLPVPGPSDQASDGSPTAVSAVPAVWDHEALQATLTGRDACWREAACV